MVGSKVSKDERKEVSIGLGCLMEITLGLHKLVIKNWWGWDINFFISHGADCGLRNNQWMMYFSEGIQIKKYFYNKKRNNGRTKKTKQMVW